MFCIYRKRVKIRSLDKIFVIFELVAIKTPNLQSLIENQNNLFNSDTSLYSIKSNIYSQSYLYFGYIFKIYLLSELFKSKYRV